MSTDGRRRGGLATCPACGFGLLPNGYCGCCRTLWPAKSTRDVWSRDRLVEAMAKSAHDAWMHVRRRYGTRSRRAVKPDAVVRQPRGCPTILVEFADGSSAHVCTAEQVVETIRGRYGGRSALVEWRFAAGDPPRD